MTTLELDPVWEREIYSQGHHLNRYPFDAVVSFVFRHCPRTCPRSEVRIAEIGCGAGNNLWFAAREGFSVAGLDGSQSALAFARERFEREGLKGDFRQGNFVDLPWESETFDLVIDRGSLTCVSHEEQRRSVLEVQRILKVNGFFFFNGYSARHTSASSGRYLPDGRVTDIRAGSLTGVGALHFSTKEQVQELFGAGWEIVRCEHLEIDDVNPASGRHCEWRLIARKTCSQ